MNNYLFDGADPTFDLDKAKAAGAIAISVYIVGDPGGMAHANAQRVAEIRSKGMGVLPNWERAANFFSTCSVADAKGAGAEALAAARSLGFPADGTVQVAFSFDFDCPSSRFPEMGQKVDAVSAGLTTAFIPMVYAQIDLIDYLVTHGHLVGKQWLMGSTWGNAYHPDSNVCLVQSHDATGQIWLNDPVPSTDINTVTDPYALLAWWPDGSPYGGLTVSDITDILARLDAIDTHLHNQDVRITSLFQVDTNGDGKPDITGTVQGAERYTLSPLLAPIMAQLNALNAAMAKLETAGVDPQQLAQAIAQHIKLTTQ